MEEEVEQPPEIHIRRAETGELHQVLVPISGGQETVIITSDTGEEIQTVQVPTTVTIDQLAQAAQQSYIQVHPSESGEEGMHHVQIQESDLQHGEIQIVQHEPGESIQTVHFDANGETTVHIQGTEVPVHIQPAETLQPVHIQSVHMGLTTSTADHVVVPATETLQQVVHISNQPAITVQTETSTATETTDATETVNSVLVPTSYPTEPVTAGWEDIFVESYTPYEGYVHSLEEVHRLITAYEISTITKFVKTRCSGKLFGVVRFDKKCRIWWEDIRETSGVRLTYDGTPFLIMGNRSLTCLFGPDNNKKTKIRAQEERVRLSLSGIEETKKRRVIKVPSKKKGCMASISVRHIVRFPRHSIDSDDITKRRQVSVILKEDFADEVGLPYEERFYVHLPDPAIHEGHPEGEEALSKDSVDERIIARIHELVAQGVEKLNDIQEQLNTFVTDELFKGSEPPPTSWRRFYPRKCDIRNQVYRAKGMKSKRKDSDEVAMAIQAVGGIDAPGAIGATETTESVPTTENAPGAENITGAENAPDNDTNTSPDLNKPHLNRLRYQCRDKLKLLIDVTHICNHNNTLQAMLNILNTLHSEVWEDVIQRRGDAGPLPKLEQGSSTPISTGGSTPNGTGEPVTPSLLWGWGKTGCQDKPMKKRGRKRKEDTIVDNSDPYARVFIQNRRDRCCLADRYKAGGDRKRVKKEPSVRGAKRRPGRPRINPMVVVNTPNTTVQQQVDNKMDIVSVQFACAEVVAEDDNIQSDAEVDNIDSVAEGDNIESVAEGDIIESVAEGDIIESVAEGDNIESVTEEIDIQSVHVESVENVPANETIHVEEEEEVS